MTILEIEKRKDNRRANELLLKTGRAEEREDGLYLDGVHIFCRYDLKELKSRYNWEEEKAKTIEEEKRLRERKREYEHTKKELLKKLELPELNFKDDGGDFQDKLYLGDLFIDFIDARIIGKFESVYQNILWTIERRQNANKNRQMLEEAEKNGIIKNNRDGFILLSNGKQYNYNYEALDRITGDFIDKIIKCQDEKEAIKENNAKTKAIAVDNLIATLKEKGIKTRTDRYKNYIFYYKGVKILTVANWLLLRNPAYMETMSVEDWKPSRAIAEMLEELEKVKK